MAIRQELPEEINGFKIIKDLGRCREGNKNRYALVKCKGCQKDFETSLTSINKIKSCGCKPHVTAKELPAEINGFKILKDLGYSNGSRYAIAICRICQKEYKVDPNKLMTRKHCGCIKHGSRVSKYTKEYKRLLNIYFKMRSRCYNKKCKDYYLYGEKGIKICDEWLVHVDVFCEWSLSNGYKDNLSIDRIDSSGNYEPNNCRWADEKMQARNTNRNVLTMELARQIRKESEILRSMDFTVRHNVKGLSSKFKVSKGTIMAVIYNRIWKE
jgi:hypothetical protein